MKFRGGIIHCPALLMQAMRADPAIVRTNIGILPLSDAQRSHWRSSVPVLAESITGNTPNGPGCPWENCGL
jgi:hypothetical protein